MSLPEKASKLIASSPARVGVSVIDLSGRVEFGGREDEVFAQASAIKIPILWTLHTLSAEGELSLDETLPIDPRNGAGGCGVLQSFASPATRIALGDLAVLMIVLSDNVATNLLIDRIGFDAVNQLIDRQQAGGQIQLRRKMIDQAARDAGRENTATPRSAARLMARLTEQANAGVQAATSVLDVLRLKKQSPVTAAIGDRSRLATKPGMLNGLRTEWSLVEAADTQYAMALMADGAEDSELEPLFQELALAIHTELTK